MANELDNDSIDIELIERYHKSLLRGTELDQFIRREKGDKDFAVKVRSYTEIMEGIKYYGEQMEFAETIQGWEKEIKETSKNRTLELPDQEEYEADKKVIPINRRSLFWFSGAVAASLLILIVVTTFFQKETPRELADTYIDKNLTVLSTTMGGEAELAKGISAFNERDYARAEAAFLSLSDNNELAPETTKYLGITYLRTEQYDKAIEQFNKLISFNNLYSNPGKFYLAVTLMKRSEEGDNEKAKDLLQQVVSERLPGNREASDWLPDI